MNNYERSNSIKSIDFSVSARAKRLTQKMLASQNYAERQSLSNFLANELSYNAGVERITIEITNTHQWYKKRGSRVAVRRYGSYYPKTKRISIQNRTAIRGKELAPKTFLDTLLHEWMHHYDFQKLRLNSIHTKGFYERIRSLKDRLRVDLEA